MAKESIFTRPSKREEVISRQPSEPKAFEIAEEWAGKIVKLGVTDRFGVKMTKAGRYHWDVILVDRSIAA
jgi:isopentenyl diphosphate isomerase/L-lactate dehydrogenase-like FMN-dependent dehydrogenase